jgi:hypothetical protein
MASDSADRKQILSVPSLSTSKGKFKAWDDEGKKPGKEQ